jgi:hypothetical protein
MAHQEEAVPAHNGGGVMGHAFIREVQAVAEHAAAPLLPHEASTPGSAVPTDGNCSDGATVDFDPHLAQVPAPIPFVWACR